MGLMDGKVALVTGASTGIGRATMLAFVREGATVVASSRNKERLDAAVSEASGGGGEVSGVPADVSVDSEVGNLIDETVRRHERIDVLVNSAGVGYSYRDQRPESMNAIADTPLEEWNNVMNINFGSIVHTSRRVLPIMKDSGGGAIVNIASVLGIVGHPDAHAYTAAKGAIINLTRSMATTYGRDGVRSNVVCPGYIDTPMVAMYTEYLNSEEQRFAWNPMGRTGRPDEIANGCVYLASDMGSYCNGTVLVIDGGMIATS